MATFPVSLGKTLLEGNNLAYSPAVIETQMESGPSRRTLLSSHGTTNGSVMFAWDAAQRLTWETFYMTTLKQGTVEVTSFPVDTIDGVAYHRGYLKTFSPATKNPGKLWFVTIQVELADRVAS